MLSDRTGLSCAELSKQVRGLVVTLGSEGCEIWTDGEKVTVPAEQAEAVLDPTGCGDAFRGAFLFGLERGWSLTRCVELGNRMGARKIASHGPQNYRLEAQELAAWTAA
jgi:adenosine kinase